MKRAAVVLAFIVGCLPLLAVRATGCSRSVFTVDEYLAGAYGTPVGVAEWVRTVEAPRVLLIRARAWYDPVRTWGEVPVSTFPYIEEGERLHPFFCDGNASSSDRQVGYAVDNGTVREIGFTVSPAERSRLDLVLGPGHEFSTGGLDRSVATAAVRLPGVIQVFLLTVILLRKRNL